MMSLALLSIVLAATAVPQPSQGPLQIVLNAIPGHEHGCIVSRLTHLPLVDHLKEGETAMQRFEATRQIAFNSGRLVVSGDLKREMGESAARGGPTISGLSRDDVLARAFGQWLIDDPAYSDHRMRPLDAKEADPIAHAALMAARSMPSGAIGKADPALLPAGVTVVDSETPNCRPVITISPVATWQDWAFVTTTVVWAPLAGIGQTWALHRNGGEWRIRGFIRDWIS